MKTKGVCMVEGGTGAGANRQLQVSVCIATSMVLRRRGGRDSNQHLSKFDVRTINKMPSPSTK